MHEVIVTLSSSGNWGFLFDFSFLVYWFVMFVAVHFRTKHIYILSIYCFYLKHNRCDEFFNVIYKITNRTKDWDWIRNNYTDNVCDNVVSSYKICALRESNRQFFWLQWKQINSITALFFFYRYSFPMRAINKTSNKVLKSIL